MVAIVARIDAELVSVKRRLDGIEAEEYRTRDRLHLLEDYKTAERAADAARAAMRSAESSLSSARERRLWASLALVVTVCNVAISAGWHM